MPADERGRSTLLQINVPLSSLASKWYGESNKLIAGLFTLAKKLQPTIVRLGLARRLDTRAHPTDLSPFACPAQIFVDEIDALLRDRSSDSHEVTSTIKAEFLTSVPSPAACKVAASFPKLTRRPSTAGSGTA